MCVASCPTTSYSPLAAALANIETEAAIKKKVAPFCAPEMASFANLSMKQLVDQPICPAWYLSSAELMGRCLPNISHGDENVSFFSGDRALRERHAQAHAARAAEIQGICQHPALSLQVLSTADTTWDHLSWA